LVMMCVPFLREGEDEGESSCDEETERDGSCDVLSEGDECSDGEALTGLRRSDDEKFEPVFHQIQSPMRSLRTKSSSTSRPMSSAICFASASASSNVFTVSPYRSEEH